MNHMITDNYLYISTIRTFTLDISSLRKMAPAYSSTIYTHGERSGEEPNQKALEFCGPIRRSPTLYPWTTGLALTH
jgi:hypothetical protein